MMTGIIPLSDSSSGSNTDPGVLVVRAVFVPEGEQPPADFASAFDPLHFPATLDPETWAQSPATVAGTDFDGDLQAEWHPDPDEDSFGDDPPGNGGPSSAKTPEDTGA